MIDNFLNNGTDKTSTGGSNTETQAKTRKAEFMTKLKMREEDVYSLQIAALYRKVDKIIPESFRDQSLSSSQVNCKRVWR